MANSKQFQPPRMLLRIYSLIVLALDLTTLLVGIWFAILLAIYRTFRPPSLKNVHGEVAMVIGAGRGVGREMAVQLAQLGVSVACIDLNTENCQATANRALQLSGTAKSYTCDVTNEKQVAATVQAIRIELGEVTMLFHCCGVPSPRALDQDPVEIKSTMDLAILSHFWLAYLVEQAGDRVFPCQLLNLQCKALHNHCRVN